MLLRRWDENLQRFTALHPVGERAESMADSRAPGPTSATSGQRAQTQTAKHLAAEAPYQVNPSNRTCRSAPGRANLIQDGILRASYRDGAEAPVPLEPGRTYALEIDMWSTSYVLRAGHRLRVEVTSSCFNRYDRNLNTGEPMGQGALPQVAHQTLLHDATCPSHIVLPVRSG